jgi:hypothetical protein
MIAAGRWRRHVPRALLLVGVVVAFFVLLPALPREQRLVFRVGVAPIERLTATWSSLDDGAPLGGVTLHFDDDKSGRIRHGVSLPNGQYTLAIDVARPSGAGRPAQTSYLRRVNLEGGETTIFVEDN